MGIIAREYSHPMRNDQNFAGRHYLADFFGVEATLLCDAELLRNCLHEAARAANLTPLCEAQMFPFPNGALTGFLPLRESHLALHTFPERNLLALDLFSCGRGDANAALAVFESALQPREVTSRMIERGAE